MSLGGRGINQFHKNCCLQKSPQKSNYQARSRVRTVLNIFHRTAAINASARAYISKVTTVKERTHHTALFSLFQTLPESAYCGALWTPDGLFESSSLLFFIVPMIIMVVLYVRIGLKVRSINTDTVTSHMQN